jgi:hypothetical protein
MAYFLHMSDEEQIQFVEPIDIRRHENSGSVYNPGGCLYLSQVISIDDSELSSAWREHTKKRIYENHEDESGLLNWVNGFQNFYKVDMDDKKILIIKTRDDLRKLFENYGILKDDYISDEITKISDKIAIYLNFLKNLKKDKLDTVENHPEEIVKLISSTKTHTIDIKDGMIVPPKNKGVTLVFIASVFVQLKKLYDELGQIKKASTLYRTLNWNKIRDDGYSGIYYTKNIIDAAISDKYVYDKAWKTFMQYLMTDTLIVWKDDVLTMETKENVLMNFT